MDTIPVEVIKVLEALSPKDVTPEKLVSSVMRDARKLTSYAALWV